MASADSVTDAGGLPGHDDMNGQRGSIVMVKRTPPPVSNGVPASEQPSMRDVLRARQVIAPWVKPTPARTYEALDQRSGLRLVLKHENWNVTGAFKIRGALNFLSSLRDAGVTTVCTASTGNHGLAVACAAKLLEMRAVVAVHEGANAQKVAAIRSYQADVISHGRDFDEAREWIQRRASELSGVFVSTTAPEIIAGAGTCALELLLDHPELDVIIVPVGGGGGISGAALVANALDPQIGVVGVQSAQAPALHNAYATGELAGATCSTYAEGIATRVPFENTVQIMRRLLSDFILVDDAEILEAQSMLMRFTRQQVEGAAAAPLAAALRLRQVLVGKSVALIITGGNASLTEIQRVCAQAATG